ncbi:hypothetical protein [Methylobacterium sp. ID0610]|uniref:hypothetical protein n=1 Tax=Methylobacterium carpenticola TaxID=3344827 RepID=UPI0036C8A999
MFWKADQLQGVLFPAPNTPILDAADIWRMLFNGQMPEAYQRAPGFPAPSSQADGAMGEYHLQVSSAIGRIDFRLSSNVDAAEDGPPRIAEILPALEVLCALQSRIIGNLQVIRVATVLNLAMSFKDSEERYNKFSEFVPDAKYPANASDFVYQYNVRKNFEGPGDHEMNRVLTWTSNELQMLAMQVNIPTLGAQQIPIKSYPSIGWKIDLNSATTSDISEYAKSFIFQQKEEAMRIVKSGRL